MLRLIAAFVTGIVTGFVAGLDEAVEGAYFAVLFYKQISVSKYM
jgi:hypothetical protein